MNEFILYLLKASLGIVIFYFVYWALLRKETFFRANRLFLVTSLLISLVLPFIGFHYTSYASSDNSSNIFVELNKNFQAISSAAIPVNSSNTLINWQSVLLIIYLTGLIIFLVRLVYQCVELIYTISKNGIRKVNGLRIVENDKYGLPFSFFSIVFTNPKFHSGTDLTNILAHEKVHIRENHWFDLLIVELFTIVFWFNPFVWLFERSIKQNHEYLADEGVLAQGLSVGRYQAILINQIMGMQIIGLTNNLNYSLNKKRMKMMTKMKTPKIRAYKMLLALPATALILLAFAEPTNVIDAKTNPISKQTLNSDETKIKVEAKVVDEKGMPLEGASVVVEGKYDGAMTDQNGIFSLSITKSDKIWISYMGYTSLVKSFSDIEQKDINNAKIPVFNLIKGIIKLYADEILSKGEPKQESSTGTTSKKVGDETFVVVEALPEYPGGLYALAKEIKEKSSKLKFSGKIDIGFTVDENGLGKVFQVIGNDGNMLTVSKENTEALNEAARIIYSLKRWTPGMQRGKAVPVNYNITINP